MLIMNSFTTLEEVEEQFLAWRTNKQGEKKIPQRLWDQVKGLLGHYKISVILKRLRINTTQAKDNGVLPQKTSTGLKTDQKGQPAFIKVPIPKPSQSIMPTISTITLQRGEFTLSLKDPSEGQIHLFINALMR